MRSRHCMSYDEAIWTAWFCGCGHKVEHHTLAKNCTRCSCSNGYLDHQEFPKPRRQQADATVTVSINGLELVEVQP